MVKAHKDGTKTFDELNYSEQANSINAQMQNLEAAIKANIRRAKQENTDNPKEKRLNNIKNMLKRIENA